MLRSLRRFALPRFPISRLAVPRAFSTTSASPDQTKVGLASHVIEDRADQRVRIFRPVRQATQQGVQQDKWVIQFDRDLPQNTKWVNPLMGWTSSRDTNEQLDVILSFESKEEAIKYCTTHGLQYDILEPTSARKKVKSYADNFKWKKN